MSSRRFRDSAISYGVLALVIIGLALLTGGNVVRAVVVACLFWVAATGWTWWRFRTQKPADEPPPSTPKEPRG